jgi:hypothetical protein
MNIEMNIELGEPVGSFQQKVWRATADGQPVYVKQIISDYSWWTCNASDIYEREKRSYQLLNAAGIGPLLLAYDDAARQLVLAPLEDATPAATNDDALFDSFIRTFKTLRNIRETGLERLSARQLADLYAEKGEAGGAHPQLVAEITRQLEIWHDTYGEELAFTHGDFHGGNARHNGQRVIGIIDFEESLESLPVFDATNISGSFANEPERYQNFARNYQTTFHEPLIELHQWHRFRELRGWITSCYLRNCCAAEVAQKAKNFLCDTEPEIHLF